MRPKGWPSGRPSTRLIGQPSRQQQVGRLNRLHNSGRPSAWLRRQLNRLSNVPEHSDPFSVDALLRTPIRRLYICKRKELDLEGTAGGVRGTKLSYGSARRLAATKSDNNFAFQMDPTSAKKNIGGELRTSVFQ